MFGLIPFFGREYNAGMNVDRRGLALYGGAVCLTLLLLVFALRLWRADLHVPLRDGWDVLPHLAAVKGVAENGWFLSNPSLGAPFQLDQRDYPVLDNLHFLVIKLIALGTRDPALILNLFFILTFPLATLTTLWVLRGFGISPGPALVGSLLYSFAPFHFSRGVSHVFLSAYYLVPLVVAVALDILLDRGIFLRRAPNPPTSPTRKRGMPPSLARASGLLAFVRERVHWLARTLGVPRTAMALTVCLLVGGTGAYYAFFTLSFLLLAGVLAAWRLHRLYPLATAGVLSGIVLLSSLANGLPTLLYQAEHGINSETVHRQVWDAEVCSLRLTALFVPVPRHYVPFMAEWAKRYQVDLAQFVGEHGAAHLGIVGCLGFLMLLVWMLPRTRITASAAPQWLDGLAWLNLGALLLGLSGGFGVLFNFTCTPLIRCYNRVSIFIAFFCLAAVALALDRLCKSLPTTAKYGILALVLGIGFLDQTGRDVIPDHAGLQRCYREEEEFYQRVEAAVPAGSLILQLPYMAFPEAPPVGRIPCSYDHLRGYIHTQSLRWSFGAMRGRYADVWHARLAEKETPELLEAAVLAGFAGLFLDRQGVANDLKEEAIRHHLGNRPIESANQRLAFYDLGPYRDQLERQCPAIEWSRRCQEIRDIILPTWQGEVSSEERSGGDRIRWVGPVATVDVAQSEFEEAPGSIVAELAATTGRRAPPDHSVGERVVSHQAERSVPYAFTGATTRPTYHPLADERNDPASSIVPAEGCFRSEKSDDRRKRPGRDV